MKITKKDLVAKVSEKQDGMFTLKTIESILNESLAVISEYLEEGETVDLSGFGKFEIVERNERNGINPATKERIVIPASKSVKFKPAKQLKERVNK